MSGDKVHALIVHLTENRNYISCGQKNFFLIHLLNSYWNFSFLSAEECDIKIFSFDFYIFIHFE